MTTQELLKEKLKQRLRFKKVKVFGIDMLVRLYTISELKQMEEYKTDQETAKFICKQFVDQSGNALFTPEMFDADFLQADYLGLMKVFADANHTPSKIEEIEKN